MIKQLIAIWIGKIIFHVSRAALKGGGSAAPGLMGLKIAPKLLESLLPQIPTQVIITGTNGKTTTARLLNHFATTQGIKVIRNATGSNLERGIASTLIAKADLFAKLKTDLAIWELDEAAFNKLAPKIKPQIVVILNVFRDQLDRYGEVDTVVKNWQQTLAKLDQDKTVLLLNGDDPNIVSLKKAFKGKIEFFGIPSNKYKAESSQTSTQSKNFKAEKVTTQGLDSTKFELHFAGQKPTVTLPIPGIYHIYDFLASFSAGYHLNLNTIQMLNSLKDYSPAFGRVEKLNLGGKEALMFLIKNPIGASLVFETIAQKIEPKDTLFLALNDNFADGTDVSWIWDAEIERLQTAGYSGHLICSGTRAQDMALRLKYAGFDPKNIKLEEDLAQALKLAQDQTHSKLFILPTYTAMLELQKILVKTGVKKHYWREG